MSSRRLLGVGAILALPLLLAVLAVAAKEYIAPRPNNAKSYPAHDEHPMEKLVVAADPYDTREKSQVFVLPYQERGLLPVFLIFSNTGEQPVSLVDMKVQLVTARKDKLFPSDRDDLRRRFAQTKNLPTEPSRIPIPLPRRPISGSISREGLDEIERAPFQARAVEPGSTQAGFVFFDVSGIDRPLAGAHLYVVGVKDGAGQELIYFEIPLDKYLIQRSAP
jgi:hypothetical protein